MTRETVAQRRLREKQKDARRLVAFLLITLVALVGLGAMASKFIGG